MQFSYIQDKIAALGTLNEGSPITFDHQFCGSTALIDHFQDSFANPAPVFKTYFLDSQAGYIRITGFTDLLECADLEFDLTITDLGDDCSFVMKLRVPTGWTFSKSFQDLPLLDDSDEDNAECPTLMDSFSLGVAHIIFSNTAMTHAGLEMDLVQGLNFQGEVMLSGFMQNLSNFLGVPGPLLLSGPLKEFLPSSEPLRFTGVRLGADIPLDFDLGGLQLTSSRLMLKSPIREGEDKFQTGVMAKAGIYFLLGLEVDGRPLEIVAHYDPVGSDSLSFFGYFTDFGLGGLSALDSSVGGAGLESAMPSEIGAPTGIQLTEFGCCIDLESKSLEYIFLGIGCGNTWELVPEWLTLSQLGLRFTVHSPFVSANRKFSVAVSGRMTIHDTALAFRVGYPELDFVVHKDPDSPLSIGQMLSAIAPGLGDIPEMNVRTLHIEGDARNKSLMLSTAVTDLAEFPIGQATFKIPSLALYCDYVKGGASSGSIEATMTLGTAKGVLRGTVAGQTTVSGTFTDVSLHQLYLDITGEAAVPDEMPEVRFETLDITYNLTTGAFQVLGIAQLAYDRLPFDSSLDAQLEFRIAHTLSTAGQTNANAYQISLSLNATGPLQFAEGFVLSDFSILFNYQTQTGLQLSGTFNTVLCDQPLSLSASYAQVEGSKRFSLSAIASPEIALVSIPGCFSYHWSRLDLSVGMQTVEGGATKKTWALRLDSKLSIPEVFALNGALEIASNGDQKMLKFRSLDENMNRFTIADGVGIAFNLREIMLSKDNAQSGWKFMGNVNLGITGVTGSLGAMLPQSFIAGITLSSSETKIEVLKPFAPFEFRLPKAGAQELGTLVLEVRSIGVSLRPQIGFTCGLGLGFPAELNTYFGSDVFRVYEPGNPLSMALIDTTVSTGGINLKFTTSPFMAGTVAKPEGSTEDWLDFDFGQHGAIAMKLPSFRYDMTSTYFEASGGFKITRALSVPLTPLRNFLKAVGLEAATAIFPESLPIKTISFIDTNGNLKIDSFLNMVGSMPADVKTTLRNTANLLNRLPERFKSYLKIEIPTELEFKFGFSPLGRVNMALLAPQNPIRFLYPGTVQGLVPMPGLMGIELRKLSVGTLASGTLFYGEVDAIIDQYDLPSLVASLALPANPGFPLPTSDELERRILLRNVFAVIPLSQGIPVPIPIFYDEMGFEYKGLEGFGIQAHLGFPQPDFAAGGTALMQIFQRFFDERAYRLDPKSPPAGQDLVFRFRDEYIEAPEYLGGGKIGTHGTVTEVRLWQYLAAMLNFCKGFSIEDLVQAIPLHMRATNSSTELGFFKMDGQFLITTTQEFSNGAFAQLGLNANQTQDFIDVLPAVQINPGVSNGSAGLVLFMRTGIKVSLFELEATLGLAASNTLGFNTGFKLEGKIGGFVEAELKGALLLNAPKTEYQTLQYPAATPVATAPLPEPLRFKTQGKSLKFNGTSTYVESKADSTLDILQYTVEAWVKLEKPTVVWVGLLGKPGRNFNIYINMSGQVDHTYHSASSAITNGGRTPANSFVFGKWQHIAVTNDGVNAIIYINGVKKTTTAVSGPVIVDHTPFYIGRNLDGQNNQYMKGQVSEIRIWKRARSMAEIQADHSLRLQGNEASLVSYFRFDADTGQKAHDICGLNHGRIYNGTFVDSPESVLTEGLRFATSTDNIETALIPNSSTKTFTVELRLRLKDGLAQGKVISLGSLRPKYGSSVPLSIDLTNAMLARYGIKPGDTFTYTMTCDGSSRLTYLNGFEIKRESLSTLYQSSDTNFFLVLKPQPFQITDLYEIRVWKVARSVVTDLITNADPVYIGNETNMVALWRMAKADETSVLSEITNLKATITLATNVKKLSPSGIHFKNNTQYALVPSSPKFAMGTYTVEAWFKPDETYLTEGFLVRSIEANPRFAYLHNNLSHRYYDSKGLQGVDAPGGLLEGGKWYHTACTNDGVYSRIYLNGVKIAERKDVAGTIAKETAIIMGRRMPGSDTQQNLKGAIDEVRIWSVARTEQEILRDMHKQLTGTEANLIAYYPIEVTNGDDLLDLSPNKLHGKIYGMDLPSFPATTTSTPARMAFQAMGHCGLKIGGHTVMLADMRVSDTEFWFKGMLNLFPNTWPIRVFGEAEGKITQDSLYLYAQTQVQLFGLNLLESRTLITDQRATLVGKWLGVNTLIDIQWAGDNPHFTGAVDAEYSGRFDLGAVYINGVQVSSNLSLDLEFAFHIALDFDKNGFAAQVGAKFKIEGKGFNLNFGIHAAPTDLRAIANWVRDEIAAKPLEYLAHLFGDVMKYVMAVYNATIEFAIDAYATVGNALATAYNQTATQAAQLWKDVGGAAAAAAGILSGGYHLAASGVATAMKQVAYAVGDVCTGLSSLGLNNNTLAGALQGANYAVGEIATGLKSIGKTANDIAKALKANNYGINEIAAGLKAASIAVNDIAKALKSASYAVNEIASSLKSIGIDTNGIASALKAASYVINDITSALKSIGATFNEIGKALGAAYYLANNIAGALKSVGATFNEIASALKSTFTIKPIAEALKSINAISGEIAAALKYANFAADQIASALKAISVTFNEIAKALKFAAFASDAVAYALSKINNAADAITNAMKYAGFGIDAVASGLNSINAWGRESFAALYNAFGGEYKAVAQYMKNAGFTSDEVAAGLAPYMDYDAKKVAGYLEDIGYSCEEVGNTLKNVFGKSQSEVEDILESVGYSVDTVVDVIGDLF